MKPKFSPVVYAALRAHGLSNRQAAKELGVSEASVRRALAGDQPTSRRRVTVYVIEDGA